MPEHPSRTSRASAVLRILDGQPVTALYGISEAATEGRGKKITRQERPNSRRNWLKNH